MAMLQLALTLVMAAAVGDAVSTAFTTFLTGIFAFIPNLIGALITLVVGYVIIRVVVKGLKVGFQKVDIDRPIEKTDVGKFLERSGRTFSSLIVGAVRAVLWIIVAVYTISVLSIPALTASMEGILAWIPNLVGAAIIVVAGALIASFAGKAIGDTLWQYGVSGARILGTAVKLLIYALVFDFAMIQLGFGQGIIYTATAALSWGLAAALAIGLGVPIAYSLKGVMTSMASGATTIASTLKEGQQVTIDGIENGGDRGRVSGTIRSVGMFNTVIENGSNGGAPSFLILPNSLLMDKPILVSGTECPQLWDHKMRGSMADLDNKFDEHHGSGAPPSDEYAPAPPPRNPEKVVVQAG